MYTEDSIFDNNHNEKTSNEYDVLHKQIIKITRKFDELMNISKSEGNEILNFNYDQDLTRSYILLCHSEMEEYFESYAKSIVRIAYKKYQDIGDISIPLFAICIMSNKIYNKKDKDNNTAEKRLANNISNYHEVISRNNGIKRDNISDIFVPLGLDIDKVDEMYLTQITSFGQKRGNVAHHSGIMKQNYNYSDIKYEVSRLLIGIKEYIDQKFLKYTSE